MISVDSQTTCHTDEANKLVGGSPTKSITFVGEAAPHRSQKCVTEPVWVIFVFLHI